jgi:hypothetical protein
LLERKRELDEGARLTTPGHRVDIRIALTNIVDAGKGGHER